MHFSSAWIQVCGCAWLFCFIHDCNLWGVFALVSEREILRPTDLYSYTLQQSWNNERQISAVMIKHDISPRLQSLWECLTWSISAFIYIYIFLLYTPHHHHQFLHCQPPHLSLPLTSEASNSGADSNRSLLFIVEIKGNIPCVQRTGWNSCTVHSVSWANGVASLQTVWLHPPSRWDYV